MTRRIITGEFTKPAALASAPVIPGLVRPGLVHYELSFIQTRESKIVVVTGFLQGGKMLYEDECEGNANLRLTKIGIGAAHVLIDAVLKTAVGGDHKPIARVVLATGEVCVIDGIKLPPGYVLYGSERQLTFQE